MHVWVHVQRMRSVHAGGLRLLGEITADEARHATHTRLQWHVEQLGRCSGRWSSWEYVVVQVCTRFAIESTPICSSLALSPVERSSSVADPGVLQSRKRATTRRPSIVVSRPTQVSRPIGDAIVMVNEYGY